jgi:hypothetical protein
MDLPVFFLKMAIFAGAFFVLFIVLITLLFLIGFVTPALAWFQILFG